MIEEDEGWEAEVDKRRVFTNPWVWLQFLQSTFSVIRRGKVAYALGFFACFLVVFVVAVLFSLVSQTPVIFMRMSELQQGEIDASFSAGTWTDFTTVNYTRVAEVLSDPPYAAHTPRIGASVQAFSAADCPDNDPYDSSWMHSTLDRQTLAEIYADAVPVDFNVTDAFCGSEDVDECFKNHCDAKGIKSFVLLIDTLRESEIELGRDWTLPPLGPGEGYLHSGLAQRLKVEVGDVVLVQKPLNFYIGQDKFEELTGVNSEIRELSPNVYFPVKVAGVYRDPLGKHSISDTQVIIMEYDPFMVHIARFYNPYLFDNSTRTIISQRDLREYATGVVVNKPSPRSETYLESNYDTLQGNVIGWANELFFRVGFNSIYTSLPVLDGLRGTKYLSMFLGLILNLIVFILLTLSCLLIYSLLMTNVSTRTFELGVMRMIGTTRTGVIMLLVIQAFMYSIPAVIFGLLVGEIGLWGVAAFLGDLLSVDIPAHLSVEGILWAVSLGVVIPIVSSILPIRAALSQSLESSLDTRSSKTSAVKVQLTRADPTQGVSPLIIIVGGLLAVFGVAIYYLLPLALLSMNLALLFDIFFLLLIGIIAGLAMLSRSLQQGLERLLCTIFFFWEQGAVISLVVKNLVAHRSRNQKTALMYAMSLGFIIFITVAFDLQIQTFSYSEQQSHGTYIAINSYYYQDSRSTDEDSSSSSEGASDGYLASLNEILEDLLAIAANSSIVIDTGWISHDLSDSVSGAKNVDISPISGFAVMTAKKDQDVIAVSPNLFDITIPGYLSVYQSSYADESQLSQLYSAEGKGSALLGTLWHDVHNWEIGDDFLLEYQKVSGTGGLTMENTMKVKLRMIAASFLNSAPALVFSSFRAIRNQDLVVSLPTLLQLGADTYESLEEYPIRTILFQLNDNPSYSDRQNLIADLKSIINDDEAYVYDYESTISPITTASEALQYVFSCTTIVAMMICFFSLTSSMFTNVSEQTKEIAILRALGISKFAMYRIYVYEAFLLVLASSFLGSLIGMVVSYTMTAQQLLFTQLPIPFALPWPVLITVLLTSVLCALLSSFYPIWQVLRLRVVSIFRLV